MDSGVRRVFDRIDEKFQFVDGDVEVTDEMLRHFEERTQKHIDLVKKYCREINKLVEMPELITRGHNHDFSKLQEPERTPYIFITWEHKMDREGEDFEIPDAVDKLGATRHHILTNPHHPEYHDDSLELGDAGDELEPEDRSWGPDDPVDATSMPEIDLCEQISDCCAMSEELGKNTVREWFDSKIGDRWSYTDEQEQFIFRIIGFLEDQSPDGDGIIKQGRTDQ